MGQRSQIYVRYQNHEGVQLIARYYQWNFAERMISRARYTIEYLSNSIDYKWFFEDKQIAEKITRICDTNFNFIDVCISSDILKEVEELVDPSADINEHIFKWQDNNNGRLLIDVIDGKIKYCFLDYDFDIDNIMDGSQYMEWENRSTVTADQPWDIPDEYTTQETIDYTKANIKTIEETAQLMTKEEVIEYITTDYEHLVYGVPFH